MTDQIMPLLLFWGRGREGWREPLLHSLHMIGNDQGGEELSLTQSWRSVCVQTHESINEQINRSYRLNKFSIDPL